MTQYSKPTDLPVWAESGDKVQPTDPEIQVGWPNSSVPPSRQRFNWVLNWIMQGVRYFMQRGIPEWDATEDYPQYARVQTGGITYVANVANINKAPASNPTEWSVWGEAFTLSGNVQLTANTTLNASHLGKEVRINGAGLTITIPDAGTFPQGRLILLTNASSVNAVTIARTGTNQFAVDGAGVTSITLQPGKSLILASQSGSPAYWNAIAGSNLQSSQGNTSGVVQLSVSTTLNSTHLGKLIHASGTGVTLNIPQANAVPDGSMIMFQNANTVNAVTLSRQGSDTFLIGGVSTATNVALNGGDTVTLVANGANNSWYVANGSASLGNFGSFLASFSGNGYQRLPSGLIIQWGLNSVPADSNATITLPIAFPNNFFMVMGCMTEGTPGAGVSIAGAAAKRNTGSLTQFTLRNDNATQDMHWIAIGN